eukprot:SAG11_NODE_10156_length_851_cov_0.722074_2_plen_156_part_00
MNIRDLPVREYLVTANYPIEIRLDSEVGHTPHNGATRQIRNTQHLSTPLDGIKIPTEAEEELWMKLSVTCSCPAGSVLLRDNRAWCVQRGPSIMTAFLLENLLRSLACAAPSIRHDDSRTYSVIVHLVVSLARLRVHSAALSHVAGFHIVVVCTL